MKGKVRIQAQPIKFCPRCGTSILFKIEDGVRRQHCYKCPWTYYPRPAWAVGGIILDEDNEKIVLVQRARSPKRGSWMIPAGFVEFGEHPEETLIREILEETGLKVLNFAPPIIKQVIDDYREPGLNVIFYHVTVSPGQLVNDNKENLAVAWWPLNGLPPIGFESHRQVLQAILAKGK